MTLLEQDNASRQQVAPQSVAPPPIAPPSVAPPASPSPANEDQSETTASVADEPLPATGLMKIARVISLVFHPFLVSPLAIVLILWLDQGDFLAAVGWAALCAAFVVMPGLLYLQRKLKQKKFTDADVSVQEQRYRFYIFGAACMITCFLVLIWLNAPPILIISFSAALLSILVSAIINRYWTKISIHSGTMAGVTVLAGFYSWPLALTLGLGTLAVSWARLITKRHTSGQAILGWFVAGLCVLSTVGVGLRIMG